MGLASSTITNTTIVGNVSNNGIGGGIAAPAGFTGSVSLLYDTINANSAVNGNGGGIFWQGTSSFFTLQNTIVAGNQGTTEPDVDNAAGTGSMDNGNNVIGISDQVGMIFPIFPVKSTQSGTAARPLDAMLQALQANGGPLIGAPGTQVTLPTEGLQPGSPAIGKALAVSASTDERGFPRPNTQPDVGAFQTTLGVGNAAFVEALYKSLLHRTGNLGDPSDAGGWLNALNNGQLTTAAAANDIARSPEALTIILTGLYAKLLKRAPDQTGETAFLNMLEQGGTVEQVVIAIAGSPEYANLNSGDSAFITSLYMNLLGRTPSPPELNAWLGLLPSIGRTAVIGDFVGSLEFRTDIVQQLYGFPPETAPQESIVSVFPPLLQRQSAPSAAEVNPWVGSSLDILTMEVDFASTPEFFGVAPIILQM
jgi:hypothetical protein